MKKEYINPSIRVKTIGVTTIMAGSNIPIGTPTNDKKPNESKSFGSNIDWSDEDLDD